MIGRPRHLPEERLLDCYVADRSGDPLDPPAADHLADCEACRTRYTELSGFLNGVRADADSETDSIFTADHLRHQQDHILRRIEHLSHSARVISFPGRVNREAAASTSRVAPRWLAAAAAAGLFVGVAVGGTILQPGLRPSLPGMRVASSSTATARLTPPPAMRVNSPAMTTETLDDDAFLMELEFALEPHTQELQAFDALTPRVLEVDSRVR